MAHKKNKFERDAQFERGYLWCSRCKAYRHINRFSKLKSYNYGYHYYCKDCVSSYNREKYPDRSSTEKYHLLKQKIIEMMGGKCNRCGFYDGTYALEFHHVLPSSKSFIVSKHLNKDDAKLAMEEADKCILLCANCHKTLNKTWHGVFVNTDFGYTVKEPTR
jgi:protein-arginine kinase activator protein McsA